MIHIIDRQTEQILDVMVNQSDQKIYWDTKMNEGLEDNVLIFEFRMFADSPAAKYIIPKNKLTAQDQDGFHRLFIIDSVETTHDANGKILFVSALGDHIELANDEPIPPQTLPGQTAETAVQFVLANTRYQPGQIDFAGSRTLTFDTYTNPLDALQKIASEFELELRFRVTVNPDGSITRIVDLLKPDSVFDGKEIVFGKDMTGIRRKENTENICTRLVGIGPADEDGNIVTFASVNGGKIYVEDEEAFQRWNNAGRHIWGIFEYQPEDGTEVTPQQLLDATKKEMEKRKSSVVEWEVSAAALEQIRGLEHERVRVGMNVRIKDEAFDPPIYLEARVLETEMPELDDPNGNFSYTFGNYREVKVIVPAEVKAIQKILFHNSGGWSAAKVKADIAQQIANEAKADVEAANARIDNLIAVDITALHAEIENLEAIKANVEDLFSINAQIENLRAEKANITDLEATNARIDDLVANDLTAINAEIENLRVGKADITDLNAVNATIATLQADVGSINTLLAGNLGAENFRAGAIYAGSGVIAQGAIGDAEISNLNAGKINAGILNTALVTIQGANGRMKIANNRLQVFANKTDGTLYERVSLGDVNGDGSVYGLRVRGADGQTVLLDENGVKREGITDGSITNEKIADDANISGTKLDIASVVTEINEGTTTIQSSKIFYNGKTLDIQLGTMQTTINNQGQTITNHETRITATEQGLATKVSVSQYQQDQAALSSQLSQMSTQIQQQANQIALKADAANVYTKSQIDGQFTTVNTQISNLSAQLSVQADQIATKVSRTEFDSLQIGGRNLLRNTGVQFDWSVDSFGGNYYKQHNIVLFDDYKSLRGKTVTLSFWAKTEKLVYGTTNPWFGFEFRLNFADGTNLFISLGSKTVPEGTNDWKKYSITREIPDKEILSASGYLVLFRDATGNVSLKNIKLELGNKATDWTPAPEDVQGQIDGLGSRMTTAETSISQLSNQIALKANQSTVDTLTGQVSSLQAQLTVQAGQIATKVEKNGVISAINQTAEQIKIQASKVDLTGYVTFTNLSTPGQTTIDGGNIKANSITAQKIAIADFTNLSQIDENTNPNGNTVVTVNNKKYFRVGTGAYAKLSIATTKKVEFRVNDEYFIRFTGYRESGVTSVTFIIRYFYTDGTWANAGSVNMTPGTSSGTVQANVKITGAVDETKTLNYIDFFFEKDSGTTGYYYVADIELRKRYAGELIVDGSITTGKLAAKSITADKLNVTSLSAISADLGTVTAGKLNGVEITGSTFISSGLYSTITIEGGTLTAVDPDVVVYTRLDNNGLTVTRTSNGSTSGSTYYEEGVIQTTSSLEIANYGDSRDMLRLRNRDHVLDISTGDVIFGQDPSTLYFDTTASKYSFNKPVQIDGTLSVTSGWFDGQVIELSNTSLANIYIRPRSGGSVRFTAAGTTTSFVPIYTSNVFTTSVDINTGGTHLYARPSSSGNLKVTAAGTVDVWRPVEAESFQNRSLERYKQDIELWNGSALDIIRNSEIYQYRSKTDVQNGIDKLKYGFIIGEGYRTPNEVITHSGESVDIYVQSSVTWKAIQELDVDLSATIDRIAWLETENSYLKQRVNYLENKLNELEAQIA